MENDEKQNNDITRPVTAYIIWDSQEGAERCQKYFCKKTNTGLPNKTFTNLEVLGS